MSSSIKHFENGAPVWVQLGKNKRYAGVVLDSSNVSMMEHAYEVFQVELQQEYIDMRGQTCHATWVHPEPVQGYKLTHRKVVTQEQKKG